MARGQNQKDYPLESTQTDMEVHNSPIFQTGLGILSRPAT
jgi:hypothetical protein